MQYNISFLLQKGEFKKAEQMLHIALKLAQEQQNYDGITYVYDLLANLAYEQGEYGKAEKLFLSVMQRLLSVGVPKTDNKVIHISLKLSNIYRIQKNTRYIPVVHSLYYIFEYQDAQ
jgi:tetratricopeptide repeat protein 19